MTPTSIKLKQTEIGLIPEEWEAVNLGDVLGKKGYIRGPFGSALRRPELQSEGTPVYEQEHAIYGTRNFRYFINDDKLKELSRFTVQENDLIISCSGTLGKISIISKDDPKGIISQALLLLRPDTHRILPQYLKYFFTSDVGFHSIVSRSSGSVQINIAKREVIENIKLGLPLLEGQKQITEILSSLDEKIELNRKINTNLEKMVAALFKKWFVDGIDLKKLPEGWRMEKISEVADISIGRTPPRMEKEWFSEDSDDVKWISIRDLGNSGVYVNKTAEYLTNEAIKRFNIPIIPKNTAILSFKLTVGRVAITTEEMLSNEAIAHIKLTNKSISPEYIYLFLKSFDFSSLGSTSSIATAVNSKSVKEIPVIIPNEKTGNDFTKLVEPIFHSILENTKQVDMLSQIRDSLLPRLMSGKIRVNI